MNVGLKGKRILVTGAGSGIGKELCITLVKNGAEVYGVSRTAANLESLKKECPQVHTICQDLSDWNGTKRALEELPTMDGLVNNAGFADCTPFFEVTEEQLDKHFAINVKPAANMTQIVAKKLMADKKPGAVVNVSSQASVVALKDHTSYCTSKAALDQLTRCMALELGPHQIRVNAVNPTVTMTAMAMVGWSDPVKAAAMKAKIPLGKFAEPGDVVSVIMFLLSDLSGMINGVILPIDGGFLSSG